jgi:uncharacterized integral membrane protein
MARNSVVWLVVGILAAIALIIFIIANVNIK